MSDADRYALVADLQDETPADCLAELDILLDLHAGARLLALLPMPFAERCAWLVLPADEAEAAEERAAVMEYDGGVPRQEAEARALGLPWGAASRLIASRTAARAPGSIA